MIATRTAILTAGLILAARAASAGGFVKVVPIKHKADVSVFTSSGEVKISGWQENQMKVEGDADLAAAVLVDGDNIRIGSSAGGGAGRIGAKVVVHVPAGSKVAVNSVSGDLACKGVSGWIRFQSISGDLEVNSCAGNVSLTTTSGDVRLSDLQADVSFKSVSGDVAGKNLQGSLLEGKTVSGNLILQQAAAAQVRLKTVSGEVKLEGVFPPGGAVRVSTLSGDAVIRLPADAGFDLAVTTRSGSIRSEFELQAGESGGRRLQGRVGPGGTEINVTSFSGDVSISKL